MTESKRPCDQYYGVRALVLGASGFIGRWVARLLYECRATPFLVVSDLAKGEQVFAEYGIRGEIIAVDLRDRRATKDLVLSVHPSITFNCAGYGVSPLERDEATAYQINEQLIDAVCEAVAVGRDQRWTGQDIVHLGSALEYGTVDGNLHEASAPRPTCVYGRSKLAGTRRLIRSADTYLLKAVTARLFTVYGPGERKGRLLPSLIEAAKDGRTLRLTRGEQRRDFTYVEDVADGLLRLGLVAANSGEIVNLATGRLTSVRRFTETAAEILGLTRARLEFGELPTRRNEMSHSEVTIERLQLLTQWAPPTTVEEGIRRTASSNTTQCSSAIPLHAIPV